MREAKRIRKAILPVAGLGTRFLPATKAIPKEMIPVVDKPVVQYAVDEAMEAGIEQFVFITGRGKGAIEDHFDSVYELESVLGKRGKHAELKSVTTTPPVGSCCFVRQKEPLGLGHAVWCARDIIGDEPFAVLLPDDLLFGAPGCLAQMVEAYNKIGGGCVVAAQEKPLDQVSRYGVINPGKSEGNITEVKSMVEKPKPEDAPSRLCVIGRYLLQPEIFDLLGKQERGAGNEIQLTDAMTKMIGTTPFHAVETSCQRYDCGNKLGFLQANLAVGLQRPDIAPELKKILAELHFTETKA